MKQYNNPFVQDKSVFDKGTDIIIQIVCGIIMFLVIGFVVLGIVSIFYTG